METRWFLTIDWCNKGQRGIFCDNKGKPYSHTQQHTKKQMRDILGPFWLVLNPISLPLTEREVATEVNTWYPLEEYSNAFGYAVVPENIVKVATARAKKEATYG